MMRRLSAPAQVGTAKVVQICTKFGYKTYSQLLSLGLDDHRKMTQGF
jgi:DNA-binding MurR/RpiR family transcriptional regulator